MALAFTLLFCGLALLLVGGEVLVRGASSLALRLKISPLIIGIIIVGFGTSTPELLVSIKAALAGAADIAVGNVVGSNIANILLILGSAALISPFKVSFSHYRRDLGVMIAASALLLGLGYFGLINRLAAFVMLALLAGYLIYIMRQTAPSEFETVQISPKAHWALEVGACVAGIAALVFGAQLLVDNASFIARAYEVSEAAIGLTVVAVGTSLPELAASIMAALKRQPELALGNIIGSNIFNIIGILSLTALVQPVPISAAIASFDIPVMLGVALLLLACFWGLRGISRFAGCGFLLLYGVYVWLQF
jgi:cation:H+ antiporter